MKHETNFDTPAAAVYREALSYLHRHGWCKYVPIDSKGRVCLIGALSAACGGQFNSYRDPLRKQLGVDSISQWNDEDVRTFADVEAALLEAIHNANTAQ